MAQYEFIMAGTGGQGLVFCASFLAEAIRGASASQELGETDFKSLNEDEQQEVALAIVRRETGVMAVAALVIAFLIWRAISTTAGMF